MGFMKEMRDTWTEKRKSFMAESPNEHISLSSSSHVQEAVVSGAKTAAVAGIATAIPTLIACRVLPWAKLNLNYTAQALIISSASVAGFFIAADRTILESAKNNAKYEKNT
ncbi:hypothetical protein LUZ60_008369 [Juncus effusus]|nr:hypothetical protein LUZ60_008369 [Juncus effusus]